MMKNQMQPTQSWSLRRHRVTECQHQMTLADLINVRFLIVTACTVQQLVNVTYVQKFGVVMRALSTKS